MLANGAMLAADDYSVSYSNNKRMGTGKVTVIGTGNVTGSATTQFEIIAAATNGDNGGSGGDSGTDDNSDDDNGVSGKDKDDDGKTTVVSSDDNDDSNGSGTDRGDGWTYFEPAANAQSQDTSLLGSVSVPPAVNIAVLAICCLAFAAAIFYATHARKETDDQLPGEPADA